MPADESDQEQKLLFALFNMLYRDALHLFRSMRPEDNLSCPRQPGWLIPSDGRWFLSPHTLNTAPIRSLAPYLQLKSNRKRDLLRLWGDLTPGLGAIEQKIADRVAVHVRKYYRLPLLGQAVYDAEQDLAKAEKKTENWAARLNSMVDSEEKSMRIFSTLPKIIDVFVSVSLGFSILCIVR